MKSYVFLILQNAKDKEEKDCVVLNPLLYHSATLSLSGNRTSRSDSVRSSVYITKGAFDTWLLILLFPSVIEGNSHI